MNSNSVRSCNALSARGSGKSSKHSENCFIGCSIPIRSHLQNQFLPALQLLTYIPNMRFPCPPRGGWRIEREANDATGGGLLQRRDFRALPCATPPDRPSAGHPPHKGE